MKKHSLLITILALILTTLTSCFDASRDNPYDPKASNYVRAVYVSAGRGDDNNVGSMEEPVKTIQEGITKAQDYFGSQTAEVRVAEGTYTSDYNGTSTPVINMVNGISVYGGYSSSFGNRNASSYITIVEDTSTSGGSVSDPNRVVYFSSGIASSTVLDGFTINGGEGTWTAGIFCNNASPTIQNNTIDGGLGSSYSAGISNYSGSDSYIIDNTINGGGLGQNSASQGIYNSSSAPIIENNTIDGGKSNTYSRGIYNTDSNPTIIKNHIIGGNKSYSYGIYCTSSSPRIWNNTIYGGEGDTSSYTVGIYIVSSSNPEIRNNTIEGGRSMTTLGDAYLPKCIHSDSSSSPYIDNNILLILTGYQVGYGIYVDGNYNHASLYNNNFYNCGQALFRYSSGTEQLLTTISAVNGLSSSSSNINADPVFEDMANFDYSLTTGTPSSVYEGGLNLSSCFTYDKDGNNRTVPFSIGAYEYNN